MILLIGLIKLISILFLCFVTGIVFDYKIEKTDNKNLRFKKYISQIQRTFNGIGEIIVIGIAGLCITTLTVYTVYLICYVLGGGIK